MFYSRNPYLTTHSKNSPITILKMSEVCFFRKEYKATPIDYDYDEYSCLDEEVINGCNRCGSTKRGHFYHSIEVLNTCPESSRANLACHIRFNVPDCNREIEDGEETEFIGITHYYDPTPKIRKLMASVKSFEFTPTTDDSDLLLFDPFIPDIIRFFELQSIDKIKDLIRTPQEYTAARKSKKGKKGSDTPFVIEDIAAFVRTIKDEINTKLIRVVD